MSVHELFFTSHKSEKKDEWAQRDFLISVLFPWANSEIPDIALWVYSLFSSAPNVEFLSTDMCG